jgi:YihY family inner membrane protein
VSRARGLVGRVDAYQRRRSWLGFPLAVRKRFSEDQGGHLAALIAYYGFFSLFPLLLILVTVLGFVLEGHPDLRRDVADSALANFPVVGDQLTSGDGIKGSGLALAVGIVGALWAGLGVTSAVQEAMNRVWDVPFVRRPGFLATKLRGLMLIAVLGGSLIVSTGLAGLGGAGGSGPIGAGLAVLGIALSLLVNLGLFLLTFKLTTSRDLAWRTLLPGAAVGAVLWAILQAVGGWYVSHQVQGASATYGTFALVIGLLSWIYLGAILLVYCAEINVVLARRLWPRGILYPPITDADERALRSSAEVEERIEQQDVEVRFRPEAQEREPERAP